MQKADSISGQDSGSIFTKQFIILFAAAFLYAISVFMQTPLVAGLSAQLGGSGTLMGLSVGIFTGVALLTRPIAGYAADRFDKKNLSFWGLSVMTLGIFGIALSGSSVQVVLFRTLAGIGFAFCSIAFSTCIAASAPEGKMGSVIGLYSMLQAIAMAIGPTLGLQLSERIGYRGAFMTAGFIALSGVALTAGFERIPSAEHKQPGKIEIFSVEVLPVSIIVMLSTIPYMAITSFLKIFALERGLPLDVSWYFTFYAFFLLVMRTALNKTFDTWRYSTFVLITVPAIIAALGILQITRNPWQLILSALFMASGYGIIMPVSQAKSVSLVTRDKHGLANSTYYIGSDLGSTCGSLLAGGIYQKLGAEWIFPLVIVCPLLICIVLGVFRDKLNSETAS